MSNSLKRTMKTSIDDLPNELLTQILSCLSIEDDLDNVQQVSKRWWAIVDETIGRDIAISTLSSGVIFDEPVTTSMGSVGLDMIAKLGVKTCFIEFIKCAPVDEADRSILGKLPTFKYPHLLKEIYFNGSIRSDVFKKLLQNVEFLTVLELNMLTVSMLKKEDLELTLPHLKCLGVRRTLRAGWGNLTDDEVGLPNFRTLLGNQFPALSQIDVRFPIQSFVDYATVMEVLRFVKRHPNLKKLLVHMEFPVQVDLMRSTRNEFLDLLKQAQSHGSLSSLETVEIQGIRLHGSYPQLELWWKFLETLKCLKSLTTRLGNATSSSLQKICDRNSSTLENLYLYKLNETGDAFDSTTLILDCTVFSSMKVLQVLYALGVDLVLNSGKLPKSLITIFLTGSISTEEVSEIMLDFQNIQFISLKHAYDEREGCGVTLDILQEFIEARKVKRLLLSGNSLVDKLPRKGIPNGDPENPSQLTEYDNWDSYQDFLDWELNHDDYYVNKCY